MFLAKPQNENELNREFQHDQNEPAVFFQTETEYKFKNQFRTSLSNSSSKTTMKYLPMVENWQTECLSLSMRSQIRLEPKWVDGRHECFDGVQRRSRYWCILSNVPSILKKMVQ